MRQRPRLAFSLLGARVVRSLALASVGAIVLSFMELAIALLIQLFLQGLGVLSEGVRVPETITRLLPTATHVVFVLLAIGVCRAVAQVMVANATVVALEVTQQRLRQLAVYELLLHPKKPYVPLSRLTLQLGEHFAKAGYFGYAIAGIVGAGVQALVLSVLLFVAAPREALFAMVGLGVTGILVRRMQRRSASFAEKVPVELTAVTQGIERVARNMFLVRSLRTESREYERFRSGIDNYATHATVAGFWGSLASAAAPLSGTVLIVLIVFVSQRYFHTHGLTLLSFLYLFVRFVQSVANTIAQMATAIQYGPQFRASLDYLEELGVDSMQLATADARFEPGPTPSSVAPAVRFAGVWFRYGDGPWVLSDFDCEIGAGEQVAIVGPSGAGKSTILALLLGITEPARGTVRIDGSDPEAYFRSGHRIGYVGAEAYLVVGTIADNLCYGLGRTASEDEMWRALRRARLETAVRAQAGGLLHPIREDGAGLSAGQKQRLCLARALLAEPGLLVLDEASANVDEATEAEIADMLLDLKGTVTVVIVSHRPLILRNAERRVQLGSLAS